MEVDVNICFDLFSVSCHFYINPQNPSQNYTPATVLCKASLNKAMKERLGVCEWYLN